MSLGNVTFKRRFSVNYHGNLRLKCGEMSFHKDFINDRRGDPYPLIEGAVNTSDKTVEERVENGKYTVLSQKGSFASDIRAEDNGTHRFKRLLGGFFPWQIYEIDFSALFCGGIGVAIDSCEGGIEILLSSSGTLQVKAEDEHFEFEAQIPQKSENTLSISFRSGKLAVYIGRYGSHTQQICDLSLPTLDRLRDEKSLFSAHAYLLTEVACGGKVTVDRIEWFLAAGFSQADLRPVKYESGEIMLREGRVFLTASARLETGSYQVVISFDPSLCDFRMEGALFFDCGDGRLCGDVASSIVFDRTQEKWLIWMCMFSHGHYLGRTITAHCPLFGINYIDVTPMKAAKEGDPLTAFLGFRGDEDPDLIKIGDKWHLAICRLDGKGYKYYHFISSDPLDGFKYVDHTPGSEKTGGSFVLCHDGKIRFVCGSDFSKRAVYDVYPIEDFTVCEQLKCDFDDGGFRGWGSIMLLPFGTRRRYTWVTFDRHNATKDNWSYGNVYVFDSQSFR